MRSDIPDETLVGLVFVAVREALRTEDSAAFLNWMRTEASRTAPELFDSVPPELAGRMAFWMGVAIWNATPLPGNGFRPRPLPQPQRNRPCVCGSGRKLKHCCGERPALPPIPADVAWHAAIMALPAAQVREAAALLMPGDPLLRVTLTTMCLSRGENQRALDTAGSEAASEDGIGAILDICRVLALYRLGHKGEALSELSRAIARSPDVAYLLAVDAPRPRAARRAAQAIAASAGSFELLRVLLRDEPELHLWLRERDAKARPRSRRTAAAPAAESKAPRRLGAGSPPRLSGPRPLRARPPAVPREDQQAAAPKPADARLRLKVTLLGTRPPIWRRLEVAGTLTLPRFHHVLQAAMGWTDSHLHMFIAGRTHYSDPSYELDIPMRSERGAKLGALLRRRGDRIDYEYDFG